VLVGGFTARLYSVNRDSGEVQWEYEADNWILATPVITDGTAYFGDFDGVLHAVNAESGAPEWSLDLDRGKIRASSAVSGDFVVVGTDEGWLIGVNRQTQQLAWEVELGTDILADLVADGEDVLIAPRGCVNLSGSEVEVYYHAVEAASGTLRRVEAVC
jgi:outer membrane protein assembly factor BamB